MREKIKRELTQYGYKAIFVEDLDVSKDVYGDKDIETIIGVVRTERARGFDRKTTLVLVAESGYEIGHRIQSMVSLLNDTGISFKYKRSQDIITLDR